ncbi:hypothetical protein Bca52824_047844 [Brassica carinata]|uniref:Uncharacterized protein n=1 Tax=Brassica carinata TaxID=52824 RepID=A0A8X7UQC1_BRACI|nr:hypothetical protein Bca52824_047844 [Brassica carinata]
MTALPIIAPPSSPASFFHSGSPSATQAPVGILSFSPLPPLGESFYLAVTTPSPEVPFAQLFNSNSNLSIDTSSMVTCSDGSEHCPHRSFAQPSRSKKSDRNQKYVDDSSPETVRL